MLSILGILIYINNYTFDNKKSNTYSGQTLQCFNEWDGDFKTRDDDWFISLKIINAYEGELTLKYKGIGRFLVEADNIFYLAKNLQININDGDKELLSINKSSFDKPNMEKVKETIEIKINSDENLDEKFNSKDIMNLDIKLDFEFSEGLKEQYWSTISVSPIKKMNFEYLKKRYMDLCQYLGHKKSNFTRLHF